MSTYLSRAARIPRTNADSYHVTDGNIAAIDFGTTSVSLAYTTKGDDKIQTLFLDTKKNTRILNVVLLKKEGERVNVEAFGSNAKKVFAALRSSHYSDYIYFERIKMLMKRDKAVHRQTLVESFSKEKFYLVEVIAFILKYLKDLLIDHLSRTVKPLKTTDFDWVITVPAIWDARGKRMMREAAYLAGLLTGSAGINCLSSVSSLPPPEVNPEKLSLALEPEAAALYSQGNVADQIEGDKSQAAISRPTEYMVIDIGGGTVDITAHIEVDGSIQVDNIPSGNAWGGTQVNEAFSQLLQKLVRDPGYKKFLAEGNHHSKQMATVNEIVYDEFENVKTTFGQQCSGEIAVKLPHKFAQYYGSTIIAEVKKMSYIEYEDDTLYIDESLVVQDLFGPTIDGIIKGTKEAIIKSESKVNTFYLVGGFGGCKYVHQKVTAAIKSVRGKNFTVIIPVDPHLAVARGAVLWRKNPEMIKARRSDATYGIGVSLLFDASSHDEHYKYYDEEESKFRCKNVFCVFLEKGELAQADKVISTDMMPRSDATTQMFINIYSTPNVGVKYVVDKNDKSTVTKIGQLVLDVPNPDNLPREKRLADITMDFSGTEIQAKAKYRVTEKEVKTVCDFLSAKPQ